MTGCSSGDLSHRHSGCPAHRFRKDCRLSSLHCAKVTGLTQGQHGLLGKAGAKLAKKQEYGAVPRVVASKDPGARGSMNRSKRPNTSLSCTLPFPSASFITDKGKWLLAA